MTLIVVEDAVESVLAKLTEWTEIRDKQGNLLGYFAPTHEELVLSYAELGRMFDPGELKRRRQLARNDPGITTEKLLENLRSLEKAHEVDCRLGTDS